MSEGSTVKKDRVLKTPPTKSDRWYRRTRDNGLVKVSTFVAERDREKVRAFGKKLRDKFKKECEKQEKEEEKDNNRQ